MSNFEFVMINNSKETISQNIIDKLVHKNKYCLFEYKYVYYKLSSDHRRCFIAWSDNEMSNHVAEYKGNVESDILFFDGKVLNEKSEQIVDTIDLAIDVINDKSPEYLSGKFVYGVFSGKDTSFVAPSLLGQYHCYFSHIESYDICSNNPYLCQSYLLDNNVCGKGGTVSNRCNLNSMIWLTYVGATYDLTTSLNNVYRFPVNAVYSYSDKACFSCLQENYFRHIFSEEYTELYKGALESSSKLVRAMSKYYPNMSASLTGGFDSRVTLAFLLKNELADKIDFFVLGDNSEDTVIAKDIAKHFNLKLEEKPFDDVRCLSYENSVEVALNKMYKTAGAVPLSELIPNSKQNPTYTGVFNEVFRGYYSFQLSEHHIPNDNIRSYSDSQLEILLRRINLFPYDSFTPYFKKKILKQFKKISNLYDVDNLLNTTRLPQFHSSFLLKDLLSIGFLPILNKLAMCDSATRRATISIPFELINDCAPALLEFPIQGRQWPALKNQSKIKVKSLSFDEKKKDILFQLYENKKAFYNKLNLSHTFSQSLNDRFFYFDKLQHFVSSEKTNLNVKLYSYNTLITYYGISLFYEKMNSLSLYYQLDKDKCFYSKNSEVKSVNKNYVYRNNWKDTKWPVYDIIKNDLLLLTESLSYSI